MGTNLLHQRFSVLIIFFNVLVQLSLFQAEESVQGSCNKKNSESDCQNTITDSGFIDESLNGLDQEDPILIEAIKKLLLPIPSKETPYNFSKPHVDINGQYDQALLVSELFKDQEKGFFIEAGAYDGEVFSNSLFYELKHGWTGLLVEPNPDALSDLIAKHRKAHVFGHCLSTKKTPEVVAFDAAGLLGGIINEGKMPGTLSIDPRDERNRGKERKPKRFKRRTIRVQCFPLYSILLALGNPTVDLLSLDIEGAEWPVLQTIPWDKVNIRVLIIEINHLGEIFIGSNYQLRQLMSDNGYKKYKGTTIDDVYVKRKFNRT